MAQLAGSVLFSAKEVAFVNVINSKIAEKVPLTLVEQQELARFNNNVEEKITIASDGKSFTPRPPLVEQMLREHGESIFQEAKRVFFQNNPPCFDPMQC